MQSKMTMTKSQSASSPHASQNEEKPGSIVRVPAGSPILRTPEDLERLRKLAERPDSEIDFSDIPRLTDEEKELAVKMVAEQRARRLQKAS